MVSTSALRNIVPFVVLAGLFTAPVFAEIYKCRDANGKLQYTDRPCVGESSVFTPEKAPVADEDSDERMNRTRKLLDAMEAERNQKEKAAAEQKVEKERRQRNCNNARDRYRRIIEASRLYELDKDGNRVVMNDVQRAQTTERARAAMERWCNE
ncbi:MAG: DUF4124 domain-containing protein [Gammaproteobacteria bacterium]|nr:MAG: DUF4124 domain-containing protein [Gammaproteobacteria bacterium]